MNSITEETRRLQTLGNSLEKAMEIEEAQQRVNKSDWLCMGCRKIGPDCYCGNLLDMEILCIGDPEYRESIERIYAGLRARRQQIDQGD